MVAGRFAFEKRVPNNLHAHFGGPGSGYGRYVDTAAIRSALCALHAARFTHMRGCRKEADHGRSKNPEQWQRKKIYQAERRRQEKGAALGCGENIGPRPYTTPNCSHGFPHSVGTERLCSPCPPSRPVTSLEWINQDTHRGSGGLAARRETFASGDIAPTSKTAPEGLRADLPSAGSHWFRVVSIRRRLPNEANGCALAKQNASPELAECSISAAPLRVGSGDNRGKSGGALDRPASLGPSSRESEGVRLLQSRPPRGC